MSEGCDDAGWDAYDDGDEHTADSYDDRDGEGLTDDFRDRLFLFNGYSHFTLEEAFPVVNVLNWLALIELVNFHILFSDFRSHGFLICERVARDHTNEEKCESEKTDDDNNAL